MLGHALPGMSESNAKVATKLDIPTLVATLLVIPYLIIHFGNFDPIPLWVNVTLNYVIYGWFMFEFLLVGVFLAPSFKQYAKNNKLDILVLLLTIPFLPGAFKALFVLRLLRLMDIIPHFIIQFLPVKLLHYTLILSFIGVFGGGMAFAEIERVSLFDGIYWANTTITTVGYGDYSPESVGGKLLAIAVQWLGQLILGLIVVDLVEITKRVLVYKE